MILSARALRAAEPDFEKRNLFGGLTTMLRQYSSHEVPFFPVALELPDVDGFTQRHEAATGPEGFVNFNVEFEQKRPLPEKTSWERGSIQWIGEDGNSVRRDAYILAPGTAARLGVISDIDDTIIETGITGKIRAMIKNWRRVFTQMPSERIMVPGAREFFAAIGGSARTPEDQVHTQPGAPNARIRPVFYVSSSPWNLFSYLVTFKRAQELPLGPIMLRDWGLNRKTLGSKSHGSHKVNAIAAILNEAAGLKFILVGDDTQKDPFAFADIVGRFPERIAGVFIRSVSGDKPSVEASAAHAKIEGAGIPFWTGTDYAEAIEVARMHGLDYAHAPQTRTL